MSQHFAAAAVAATLLLATAGAAQAQSTPAADAPATTMTMPGMPKVITDAGSTIPLREVVAIGTGVIIGATLFHVVIGHGVMLAGAAIGGWIGDWCYNTHATPALHTGG